MIPVNPPAANASRITAGSQKRRRICLRSPGGAATIAPGVYDFKRLIGGFAAILLPAPLGLTMLKNPSRGNVDSHSHRAPFLIENYIPAQREPRSDKSPGGALDRDPRTGARIPAVLGRKDLQTLAPN